MDREKVIAWMQRRGLNNRSLAELLGISEDKVSKSLATNGKPRKWQGAEVARILELMREDEDLVRSEVRGTGMAPQDVAGARNAPKAKPLPLYGSAWGGEWEDGVDFAELRLQDALDYLARPEALRGDPEAYAVEIVGESMAPRYEPKERAAVSPRASVSIGDDVIVQVVKPGEEGSDVAGAVTHVLIKRLVRRTAEYIELCQYRPEKTFRVPLSRIARDPSGKLAVHKVTHRI